MSDTEIDMEDHIILKRPLWRTTAKARTTVQSDVTNIMAPPLWAVTVNVKPNRPMNRRQWFKYEPADQIKILGRIEAALRRENPSIVLKEIHYESCPNLTPTQIHFHALYQMPEIFVSTMANWYDNKIGYNNADTKIPWKHLEIVPVYNENGWKEYIRKDAPPHLNGPNFKRMKGQRKPRFVW